MNRTIPYRPEIDGLRAIAVLSVVVYHLNSSWLPGGFTGVDVFFVISAYLITSIIYAECKSGTFTFKNFYQRRIARIFPAFTVMATVSLLAAAIIYDPQNIAIAATGFVFSTLSVANIKFAYQESSYFDRNPDSTPFLHCWSLSMEEQFYLIFPMIMAALSRKPVRLLWMLAVVTAVSFLACIFITPRAPNLAFYLLPMRAWEFAIGSFIAVLHGEPKSSGTTNSGWMLPVGIGLVLLSTLIVPEGNCFPGGWALLPVAGSAAVIASTNTATNPVLKLLTIPTAVFIGRVSYSLYLWHWPIFSFVDYAMFAESTWVRLASKLLLTCMCTLVSYFWIERPMRVLLNKPTQRKLIFAVVPVLILCMLGLGSYVRRVNYVNAEVHDLKSGGIAFHAHSSAHQVVLLGDSTGTVYGKLLREICARKGLNLNVMAVNAADVLPSNKHETLWPQVFEQVQRIKPDYIVMSNLWSSKLQSSPERLPQALNALQPFAKKIILITQPPTLPKDGTREAMRHGRPLFFIEDAQEKSSRCRINNLIVGYKSEKISVIDVSGRFEKADGQICYLDDKGKLMYFDRTHLSGFGAEKLRADLERELTDK